MLDSINLRLCASDAWPRNALEKEETNLHTQIVIKIFSIFMSKLILYSYFHAIIQVWQTNVRNDEVNLC